MSALPQKTKEDLLQTQPKLKEQHYFASKENAKLLKQIPKKYLPEVNGYCAWGIAEKILNFSINPETFKM
jgi:hypothetical protein